MNPNQIKQMVTEHLAEEQAVIDQQNYVRDLLSQAPEQSPSETESIPQQEPSDQDSTQQEQIDSTYSNFPSDQEQSEENLFTPDQIEYPEEQSESQQREGNEYQESQEITSSNETQDLPEYPGELNYREEVPPLAQDEPQVPREHAESQESFLETEEVRDEYQPLDEADTSGPEEVDHPDLEPEQVQTVDLFETTNVEYNNPSPLDLDELASSVRSTLQQKNDAILSQIEESWKKPDYDQNLGAIESFTQA